MIASTCPICKGSTFDGTGHTCWGWEYVRMTDGGFVAGPADEVRIIDGRSKEVILEIPPHEQGTAVARRDPWYTPWHEPRMGLLTVKVITEIPIEMDEYMAAASMEAFGRVEDAPLIEGHRVVSASFVPYERPETVA